MTVRREHPDWPVWIKGLAKIHGKDILMDIKFKKQRKTRAKETKPRDMQEKSLERKILIALNTYPYIVAGKTESHATYNSRYDFHGFPDITCFNLKLKEMWFIECKREGGKLRDPKQINFKHYCDVCGINHLVATKLSDINVIIGGNNDTI